MEKDLKKKKKEEEAEAEYTEASQPWKKAISPPPHIEVLLSFVP